MRNFILGFLALVIGWGVSLRDSEAMRRAHALLVSVVSSMSARSVTTSSVDALREKTMGRIIEQRRADFNAVVFDRIPDLFLDEMHQKIIGSTSDQSPKSSVAMRDGSPPEQLRETEARTAAPETSRAGWRASLQLGMPVEAEGEVVMMAQEPLAPDRQRILVRLATGEKFLITRNNSEAAAGRADPIRLGDRVAFRGVYARGLNGDEIVVMDRDASGGPGGWLRQQGRGDQHGNDSAQEIALRNQIAHSGHRSPWGIQARQDSRPPQVDAHEQAEDVEHFACELGRYDL